MTNQGFLALARVASDAALRRNPIEGEPGSVKRGLTNAWRGWSEADLLKRLCFHVIDGNLTAINLVSGAPFNPRFGDADLTDPVWQLSPDEQEKALHLLGQVDQSSLRPSFKAQARPRCVPPELLALSPNAQVEYHELPCPQSGCSTGPAAQVIGMIQDQIARQEGGYYTIAEAAHILKDANPGCEVRDLIQRMTAARVSGRRLPREPGSKLPVPQDATAFAFLWLVSPQDVDAWLADEGAPYRFPAAAVEPEAQQQDTQADPQRRLHALRASGGSATRLNGKWTFKGIDALEKAEREAGRKRCSQKTIRADLETAAEAEYREGKETAPRSPWHRA